MTASAEEPHVGLVVEGPGDVQAVPLLIRRWLPTIGRYDDPLGKPVPCNGRENALVEKGLEGYVATAAYRPGCHGVLVILDSEGDPECTLGPTLLARAQSVTAKPIAIVLATPKFEGWLIASAETMEIDGLVFNAARDPVGYLKELLPSKYVKPVWQPRLTARIDIDLARNRSHSLNRMFNRLQGLLGN